MARRLSLAIVVQRYGAEINGGAELHARYLAEHLARYADVDVLTTCARDYVTWQDAYPPGRTQVNGIRVERFPVARERDRDLVDFGRRSVQVFTQRHSTHDELRWLEAEGPVSPALLARVRERATSVDYWLIFSLRYHCAYHTARSTAARAVLVPTMEGEAAVGLSIFGPVLRGVRAVMYNSFEERAMLQEVSGNAAVPGVVVGIGSEIPPRVDPARARAKFELRRPFVVYVGRIDTNKGCAELFDLFREYLRIGYLTLRDRELDLVLIGTAVLPIPDHPRIRHLGFVSDQDKFDVIAAAEALVMPSYFESLSMVALEAWALGRPVLVNAHCDVLAGQCLRSQAGLPYADAREFAGALDALLDNPRLGATLGERGRRYFADTYAWPVIERKYLDLLTALADTPAAGRMEPLPGPLARRRRDKPPAAEVVASLRRGPALAAPRRSAPGL